MATANYNSSDISILYGSGNGNFSSAINFLAGNGPWSIICDDFNGDSKPDLAIGNYTSNNVSILVGNGTGGFAAPVNFAVGTNPWSINVADFDADLKPDIVTGNSNSNNASVLLNCSINGINDHSSINEFSVFPNPSNGVVTVCMPIDKYEVKITNLIGDVVFQSYFKGFSGIIDLGQIENGSYLISIADEKGKNICTKTLVLLK